MVKDRNELESSSFTPTTAEVRTYYSFPPGGMGPSPEIAEGFDRWLAQHDREAAAAAFEAAAVRVRANFAEHGERCPWVGFLDDEAARIRTDGA